MFSFLAATTNWFCLQLTAAGPTAEKRAQRRHSTSYSLATCPLYSLIAT